jgi:hypothetical protein
MDEGFVSPGRGGSGPLNVANLITGGYYLRDSNGLTNIKVVGKTELQSWGSHLGCNKDQATLLALPVE